MITDGLIPSLFSIAILRDLEGPSGYLALGGVPPIDFVQNYTSTPILVTTIAGYPKGYDFYTIEIDTIVLDGADITDSGGDNIRYIVSGSTPQKRTRC